MRFRMTCSEEQPRSLYKNYESRVIFLSLQLKYYQHGGAGRQRLYYHFAQLSLCLVFKVCPLKSKMPIGQEEK